MSTTDTSDWYVLGLQVLPLQEGLDGFVLSVEIGHVDDEVFQHEHVPEGSDQGGLVQVCVDGSDARQGVQSVTVHGAAAADALSARAPEGECGIHIVLNVEQGVEVHGRNLLEVDVVADVFGLVVGLFGVVAVDEEPLHFGFVGFGDGGIVLDDVVAVQITLDGCRDAFKEYLAFARAEVFRAVLA